MDSKGVGGSTQLQTLLAYDDFEPFCTWQREDGQDTLVLHLPEFKKEQLRIQISNSGILKITGDRPIDAKKRSRFQKEIMVTKDYNANNIHAKFSQGRLRVTLPKIFLASLPPTPPSVDGHVGGSTTTGKSIIPNMRARLGQVLRSKQYQQAALNIGFAMAIVFSAYVAYKYWTMYVQVDED